ncbi:MAG: hypothetical protein IJL78_10085 [Lachnospiraceae bacterium]|nr:hypothetical protein [Lachnospiraceae bacterium]
MSSMDLLEAIGEIRDDLVFDVIKSKSESRITKDATPVPERQNADVLWEDAAPEDLSAGQKKRRALVPALLALAAAAVLVAVILKLVPSPGSSVASDIIEDAENAMPRNVHMMAELYTTEDAIFFLSGVQKDGYQKFMYYDKASGISNVLCGKPECTHDSEDCNAVPAGKGESVFGMGIQKEKIYWIADRKTSNGQYDGRCLYRMNLDGTGREVVRVLLPEEQRSEMISGNRYVDYTDDYVIVGGANSTIETGIYRQELMLRAYSLTDSKKDQTFLKEEVNGILYFCISGNEVYYSITTQEMREEGEEWKQASRLRVYRYNIQKQKTEALYDADVPFSLWNFCPDGDRLIISTMSDLYSVNEACVLDLTTGEISKSIPMEAELSGLGTSSEIDQGKIISYSYPHGDRTRYTLTVKDFDGNVLSECTEENTMTGKDGAAITRILAGSDADSIYYIFRELGVSRELEWLMAYPVRGGEPKLLYTNAEEEKTAIVPEEEDINTGVSEDSTETSDSEEENTFRVKLELNAEKIGDSYYIDSIDNLGNYTYAISFLNNTDYNLLNYRTFVYVRFAFNGKFYPLTAAGYGGRGGKFPSQTCGPVEGPNSLGGLELIPGNFDHGMTQFRLEVTGTLNGEDITVSDEITLYLKDEMGESNTPP